MPALRLEYLPDNIARLTFDMPGSKVNTLGQAVQDEFETLLDELEKRTDLHGLVFQSGKPGMFVAGADLKELGSAPAGSDLVRKLVQRGQDFIARFENLPYPTVALIDGPCLGGGLELAMGFDYRLAGTHPRVELGQPEVKVGLIPGWGGTQRLARLVGPSQALEMICVGEPISGAKAKSLGLVFDVVPSERLLVDGYQLVTWSARDNDWPAQRLKKRQPIGLTEDQHSFTFTVARQQVLAKTKGQLPAPLAGVDAVEKGCNLPLPEALIEEQKAFIPLVGSTISKNLIAIFFQSQKLAKDPGVADANLTPRPVEKVGIIGAGLMGAGIVGAHLRRNIPARMIDVNDAALDKGKAAIVKVMQSRIEIGKMTQAEMLAGLSQLTTAVDLAQLADRDVVVEAVVENEAVKAELYGKLQKILKPDAILASNTSTISITRMAQATGRPELFAGFHFFYPVDRMQLVEVIRGDKTSDATVVTLVALAKKLGKSPIVVRDCPGFLVNRILFPYINEALTLLEEGADPRKIDQAATEFGMPMGPITLSDVVGLDTALFAGNVINQAFADRARPSRILADLVGAGRLGQKSGAGFYSYAKGPRGIDDPALQPFLDKARGPVRAIEQAEITDRLFLSMLVEASLVLMESIVRDPVDVDMGLILGIGFPTFRGGLLRWADTVGMKNILATLKKYEALGRRFQPTEQMTRFSETDRGFFG